MENGENGSGCLEDGFGLAEWRVSPRLNQLASGARTITIEPQVMSVLTYLAARAGEVVSADELIEAVWAGRPISDNPVYKAITKLRQALGDNPRAPTYIATVSKRGYRLIAPVILAPATPPAGAPPATRARLPAPYLTLGVLLLATVAGSWLVTRGDDRFSGEPRILQLVHLPGSSFDASVAADGQRLVFVNVNEGPPQLWLLERPGARPRQLTDHPSGAHSPAWSSVADDILFVRNGDVWLLSLHAGAKPLINNASQPAWSTDGQAIIFERARAVWTAAASGQVQQRVEAIPNRRQLLAPRQPAFSPDGRQVVYFEPEEGPLGDLWLLDLSTRQPRQLTFDHTLAGAPTFTADGRWIVFHSTRGGPQSLWRIAVDGGEPRRLLLSTSDDGSAAVSASRNALTYTSARADWSLQMTAADGATRTLFASRSAIHAPELSPDGTRVTFFAIASDGAVHVYVQSLADGQPQQLSAAGTNVMPKWSGDGRWIYFYHAGKEPSWRRVRADGGAASEVVVEGWSFNREHDATIRPGGGQAMYAVLEGSAVVSTELRDLATGADIPLALTVSWPDWSSDGEQFLATEFSGGPIPTGPIVRCRLAQQSAVPPCTRIAERGQHPVWSADGAKAYFVEPLERNLLNVWRHDFATGENRVVRTIGPISEIGPFVDVTADESVIWVELQPGRSELWQAVW